MTMEIAWFGALCDDDYEFLGVPDPELASSWPHCRDIVQTADRLGFDNILLPSGYELGVDTTTFASAIATHTEDINLLVAVRMGETWLPQLAKQMASIDRMADGRLTINIISSDIPGQKLDSAPRYLRTIEWMQVLRALLNGESVDYHGEFVDLTIDPPRIRTVSGTCPPFYFGGFSEDAKNVAAREADVFLTWPDTVSAVGKTAREMQDRAGEHGRELLIGLRSHVIVRETEAEAKDAADRLISKLDPEIGAAIRGKSLDAASVGVQRQAALRDSADEAGYAEPNLWTGIGKARSGAGAAIVGDPDQVVEKLEAYADAGVSAFILSGYTHIGEAERFAEMVLPRLDHGKIHRPA
ncbi:MAG: LLM class flavin-dependent oxidoreductase [Acidimicrobiia bacterium]|nr:LLM class flavin-dependent oxidoreductase [Acidimicrobiia bacterium]